MMNYALLSEEQILQLLAGETKITGDSEALDMLSVYWLGYSTMTNRHLAFLNTKLSLLKYLQGKYRLWVSRRTGADAISAQQAFDHVTTMLNATQTEVDQILGLKGPGVMSTRQAVSTAPATGLYSGDNIILRGK